MGGTERLTPKAMSFVVYLPPPTTLCNMILVPLKNGIHYIIALNFWMHCKIETRLHYFSSDPNFGLCNILKHELVMIFKNLNSNFRSGIVSTHPQIMFLSTHHSHTLSTHHTHLQYTPHTPSHTKHTSPYTALAPAKDHVVSRPDTEISSCKKWMSHSVFFPEILQPCKNSFITVKCDIILDHNNNNNNNNNR